MKRQSSTSGWLFNWASGTLKHLYQNQVDFPTCCAIQATFVIGKQHITVPYSNKVAGQNKQ